VLTAREGPSFGIRTHRGGLAPGARVYRDTISFRCGLGQVVEKILSFRITRIVNALIHSGTKTRSGQHRRNESILVAQTDHRQSESLNRQSIKFAGKVLLQGIHEDLIFGCGARK
jgi:hypothetical protein